MAASCLTQFPMSSDLPLSAQGRPVIAEISSGMMPESVAPATSAAIPTTSPERTEIRSAERASTSPPHNASIFDDPHSLLPRFTRVRVIGNNRTKTQLVGQLGVVKHATGLGGWHRVVLDVGGEEVRLQRNALSVVSRPKGDETDFSDEDVEEGQQEDHVPVVLPRERRRRAPRPSSAEHSFNERRVSQRQAAVVAPRINLHCLDATALKRYRKHYQLTDVGDSATREQLVTAVGRHFMQQSVDETDTIERFINAAYMFAQGSRPDLEG